MKAHISHCDTAWLEKSASSAGTFLRHLATHDVVVALGYAGAHVIGTPDAVKTVAPPGRVAYAAGLAPLLNTIRATLGYKKPVGAKDALHSANELLKHWYIEIATDPGHGKKKKKRGFQETGYMRLQHKGPALVWAKYGVVPSGERYDAYWEWRNTRTRLEAELRGE